MIPYTRARHALILCGALALVGLSSSAALAQQPKPPAPTPNQPKPNSPLATDFELRLKALDSRQPPKMLLRRDDRANTTQLLVRSWARKESAERDLSVVNLPAWLRKEGYRFEVTLKPAGAGKTYVLFEALPLDEELSSGGSTTFQVAWIVERSNAQGASTAWTFIAQATYSDLDGGQIMELRPKGKSWELYRQRPLPNMRFCGLNSIGAMDLERYSPGQANFVLELDLEGLIAKAKPIQAYLPARQFTRPMLSGYFLWRAATSDLRNPADTGSTIIRPLALGDQQITTAWREGSGELGRGEFVSARVEASVPLKGMRIFPGHGGSQEQYDAHATPKKLLLGLSDGQRFVVELPRLSFAELSNREGMLLELPSPTQTSCVSVLILESYPAQAPEPRAKDFKLPREYKEALRARRAVAISELTPFSLVYGLEPKAAAKILIKTYQAEESEQQRQRFAIMARPYGRELSAQIRQVLNEDNPTPKERVRLVALLASLPSQESVPLLIDLVRTADIKTDEYRTIKLSLYAHRAEAAGPLYALIESLPAQEARRSTDLIRLLGRVASSSQRLELIKSLGNGAELVRNERIRAIAGGGADSVAPLIEAASTQPDTPAGEDALKALHTIGRRLIDADILTQGQRARLLELAQISRKRRFKLRAIDLLGRFKVQEARPFLREDLIQKAPDALLRAQAATALGRLEGASSREGLQEALVDSSPDVRISAIRAIALRKDQEQLADAVLTYARREQWKQGLEHALLFLANLKDDRYVDVVRQMAVDLERADRALVAARALSRARKGLSGEQAKASLLSPKAPFPLRHQLVELLGYHNDLTSRTLLQELILEQALDEVEEPSRVEDLRQAAMMALGQRRDLRDVKLLIERAIAEPNIKLQQTALRALSFYKDKRVIDEIEAAKAKLPPTLLDDAKTTQSIIDRRISIQEVAKELEEE